MRYLTKLLLTLALLCVTSTGNAQLVPGEPPLHAGPTTSKAFGSIITNPFGSPSTGDRVLFATPANNGVLVTNGTGVPSISTTLPSSLTVPSPSLTGTILGNAASGSNATDFVAFGVGLNQNSTVAPPAGFSAFNDATLISSLASGAGTSATDIRGSRRIFKLQGVNPYYKGYGDYDGFEVYADVNTDPGAVVYNKHWYTKFDTGTVTNASPIYSHLWFVNGNVTNALAIYTAGATVFDPGTGGTTTIIGYQTNDIGGGITGTSRTTNAIAFKAADTAVNGGTVTGFRSEVTGSTNYAFLAAGDAAAQFGGALIVVGNATMQGTQTAYSQNYTLQRAMGAVSGVNVGLTSSTSFSASAGTADVRGLTATVLPSGGTAISNVTPLTASITSTATALTTQMTGVLSSIVLQSSGGATTIRGSRASLQLSGSGNVATWVGSLADSPVFGSTGVLTASEGFTASQIGDATKVTTVKGFRMLDTSAVTSVEAFVGEVTSGTGKWNFSATGNGPNRYAGSSTFGAITVPTKTVDITGTLGVSSTSSLADTVITSPSATALAVGLAGTTNPAFQVDASTASQAAGLKLTGAATGGTVTLAAIDSGATTSLTISAKAGGTLTLGSATNVVTVGRPLGVNGALTVTSSASQALAVGPTGATSPVLAVNGSGTPGVTLAGAAIVMSGLASDATHTDATICKDTTSNTLLVGSGAAGICLGTSSLRFKTDVHPLQPALAQIDALQPISYRYKKGYGTTDRDLYGFAAEQVYQVMPELVGLDKDGRPNSVDWAGVVPVLVNAIKELKADNDNLAEDVKRLKGRK